MLSATADRDATEQAAKVLVMAYLKQMLMDRFLHADPHPGNFLLSPGPDGPRIAFVDLGFETRSGNLASLANWMMLFRFEDTEEDREAAWQRLMKAQRDDPVMRLPSELILVGRVLIVQTGLVSRIKPSWKMADLVAGSLAIPEAP
ncbi:MAG: AarF/UbiB family protein [Acidimicrobiales bacterium]